MVKFSFPYMDILRAIIERLCYNAFVKQLTLLLTDFITGPDRTIVTNEIIMTKTRGVIRVYVSDPDDHPKYPRVSQIVRPIPK